MKKALTVVLVLLVAVPAFALPYCTTGCGVGRQGNNPCCCSTSVLPDGTASLGSPPCCPPATIVLRGTERPEVLPTQLSEIAQSGSSIAIAVALAARTARGPVDWAFIASDVGSSCRSGTPAFLRNAVLRI